MSILVLLVLSSFNALRTSFQNSTVATYIYSSIVGVTSSTDIKGLTSVKPKDIGKGQMMLTELHFTKL